MRRLFVSLFVLVNVCVAGAQTGTFDPFFSTGDTSNFAPSVRASDGNYYGVTPNFYSIYQLTPGGTYSDLSGEVDVSTLCMEGSDGYLYGFEPGETPELVKVNFKGQITNLGTFPTGEYSYTPSCPVMANDGNLYGGGILGGTYDAGFLYQFLPTTGKLNIIYNFTGNYKLDGYGPTGPLLQASDGNLYGITTAGAGSTQEQTVFRFSAEDGLTLLPAGAYSPLIEGPDGQIYTNAGEIAKFTLAGAESVIYTVPSESSATVAKGLSMDGSGNFYVAEQTEYQLTYLGCTLGNGGGGNYYNIIGVNSTGSTIVNLFAIGSDESENGNQADAYTLGILMGGDGTFFGQETDTTYGPSTDPDFDQCSEVGAGDIFRETISPALTPPIALTLSKTNTLPGAEVTLNWKVNNAYSDTMQQCYGYGFLSGKIALSGSLSVTAPGPGTYTAAIICGGTQTSFVTLYDDVTYLSLAANPSETAAGVPVVLTATITNAGTPAPTGKVNFYYGSTLLGSAGVNNSGVANFSGNSTGLPPGTYSVTAQYAGDSNYAAARSAAVPVTILAPVATTMTLSPATQTVTQGQKAALPVLITGNSGHNPSGSVGYYTGTTLLGTAPLYPYTNNTMNSSADLVASTAGVAPGTYSVTAKYPGDIWNQGTSAGPVTVTVIPAVPVTVTATPNPVPAGASFQLTATVTGTSGTPTGTVAFYAGTTELATSSLNGSGVATIMVPSGTLAAGSYQVTAYYAGDSKNPTGTSPAITLTVD